MSETNWNASKMLDVYIYDYLVKRQFHATAKAFQAEGNVLNDITPIDAPSGFLLEWWTVFWDIYIARTNLMHSEAAAFYSKVQLSKAEEMQRQQVEEIHAQLNKAQEMRRQQEQELQNPNQNQQLQIQLLMQKHAEQQQRMAGSQRVSGSSSCPTDNGYDPLMRRNRATSKSMETKTYEDNMERPLTPHQKDASADTAMKQKVVDNVGQLLEMNHSLLKAAAASASGQATGAPNIQQISNLQQKFLGSLQDIKGDLNAMMRSQAVVPEESIMGCLGPNQGGSNLTLKGWPLTGLDQLRTELLQQKSLMQSPQSFNQLSARQKLMLQAQHNLASPSIGGFESRKLSEFLNDQNIKLGKDGQPNSIGDLIPNNVALGSSILPHLNSDMFLKQQVEKSGQQLQQYSQHSLSSQKSQSLHQQEKSGREGNNITVDGSVSSTLKENDKASKSQSKRKRKPGSSPGHANSSGTENTAGLSVGSLTPAEKELVAMENLWPEGTFDGNLDSFLSLDETDPTENVGKGFSFKEIKHIMASSHEIECCHFSSDGKLLATGGRGKIASLWCTGSFKLKSKFEEHEEWITDVRFCPNSLRIATSSADRTVRVWDANNPSYSLRTFTGHVTTVMSVDFHPSKDDLVYSCDSNEIRYWSIKNGSCAGVFKGGATQLRFQPGLGRLLAAAADNLVSIFDVDTLGCRLTLQGHNKLVRSICWDLSGKYLASLSEDLAKVWSIGSGGKGDCLHELNASGHKFNTCAFHPTYPVLIIGCQKILMLWDYIESKTMTLPAHDNVVSSLAISNVTGLVASTSYDKHFKIWK